MQKEKAQDCFPGLWFVECELSPEVNEKGKQEAAGSEENIKAWMENEKPQDLQFLLLRAISGCMMKVLCTIGSIQFSPFLFVLRFGIR